MTSYQGGYVKIALGGALFSISHHINRQILRHEECILTNVISIDEAGNFAQTLVEARDEYDLDGVDLDVEDGGAPTEIQVEFSTKCYAFEKCRPL